MKKGSSRFKILIIVMLVVVVIAGFFFNRKKNNEEITVTDVTEKKININIVLPEKGNIGKEIKFNGEVKAMEEFILSSRISEKIKAFNIENGQTVKKGDIIVELDEVNYTQNYRKAEASLKSAKMNFDITKRDFERNTTLFEKKVINEKTYDSVRNSYQRAQETLIQAEAQYEMAKRDFESLKVRAPFDGIVVDRNGNSGQLISPGFVFGRVLDISKVDVETYITSEQITSLKIGSRADIGNVAGEVVSINRAADKDSRNFLIKIRFDNKDNSFIEGSFVQGSVYTEYYENVLLIPNKSLLYDENGYFIFLHEDGKAVRLEVFVKAKNKDKVYVSGINETSEIIVSGQSIVKDGSLVSISEE